MEEAVRQAGLDAAQPIEPCSDFLDGPCATLKEQHDEMRSIFSGTLVHDAVHMTVVFEGLCHDHQLLGFDNCREEHPPSSLSDERKRDLLFQASVRR